MVCAARPVIFCMHHKARIQQWMRALWCMLGGQHFHALV